NARVSQREVAIRVRMEAVEIERRIRLVVAAVVEDDNQAVEWGVAGATVVQLDELRGVRPRRIGIHLVDDDVCRNGRGSTRGYKREREIRVWRVGRIVCVAVRHL